MIEATAKELHQAYWGQGKTLVDLAQHYGRSPGALWYWFRKLGVPTRSVKASQAQTARAVSSDEVEEMLQLYSQGWSCADVGKKLGRAAGLVGNHLRLRKATRSQADSIQLAITRGKIRTTTLKEHFFETLTPASAWVLGLIFGDGHVRVVPGQSYSVYLAGTEDVLQQVTECLGSNRKVRKVTNSRCWISVWNSKTLVGDLVKLGLLGGRKATTMRWPTGVPAALLPHFIRGLMDSDGGWQRRGSSLRATYTSASRDFISELRSVFEARGWTTRLYEKISYGAKVGGKWHTPPTRRLACYDLVLNADSSRSLAEWIYSDSVMGNRCEAKRAKATEGTQHGL